MSKHFLQLSQDDRIKILELANDELSMDIPVLEKDAWVCWTLGKLFALPNAKPMAFKGGTSLSKIWKAIDRFSEDIDVTIDYRSFGTGFDHETSQLSSNKRKKISEELRERVKCYTIGTVFPYLEKELADLLPGGDFELVHSDDGERITLSYPSVASETNAYMSPSVLLEFGGRNTLEPNATHSVTTYLSQAESTEGVIYPEAHNVVVVDIHRTFWEKVTLIHARCGKNPDAVKAERLSRHWYDLHILVSNGHINVDAALDSDSLLREVVALKKVFYYAATASYDSCLDGGLNMQLDSGLRSRLADDYEAMKATGFIPGETPTFDQILGTISHIQDTVNGRLG